MDKYTTRSHTRGARAERNIGHNNGRDRQFSHTRDQRLAFNGTYSKWQVVRSGIHQGLVLGPMLFIMYRNSMPECAKSPKYLFADDVKLFRSMSGLTTYNCGLTTVFTHKNELG